MEIKITTLAENTAEMGFLAEWGLSMFVEADGAKVLFDTGMGIAAVHNAHLLGLDLGTADKIVLSHGHYDHTGGLREVLMLMKKEVEVIAHPDIWASKYGGRRKGAERYSGLPFRRELLENLGARFNLTDKPVHITDRFMTTGEVPMLTDYEQIDSGLFDKETGEMLPDELKDDLALVIDADFGLVVILGCAHHGIVNTLKQAQKITGKELIYAAIGGTHLLNADLERWAMTAADLKEMGVQYLGVSHCTGFEASAYLAQEFGDRFFLNNSGSRWTLPFA
ncbi:MAG: MBL fold metallo-hydrolase [Dehalococcoidales bacterium]|jgi:7,8-dihydropterin-6-yl-methyl-4-(beta-D-ribofuranosyl)aminobenzene 5'-phosphate synthase